MAENKQIVKLYTKDTVAATSSKGNQEKWYNKDNNHWYKLDRIGFEALAEAVVSDILINYSNIEKELKYKIVPYHIESVSVHGKERTACASPNFLKNGQSIQTVYHILKRVLGPDYQQILKNEKNIQNRLKLIADIVEQVSGLKDFGKYLTLLFEIDALTANEDRHLNNIAVIEKNGRYDYCPIFDNGEALMLDNVNFPFDVAAKSMLSVLRAKPFNCRYGKLLTCARELYGRQLVVDIDKKEIEAVADKYLHRYQPFFRPLVKERIVTVITSQYKKYFE